MRFNVPFFGNPPLGMTGKLVAEDGDALHGAAPVEMTFQVLSCGRVVHLQKNNFRKLRIEYSK